MKQKRIPDQYELKMLNALFSPNPAAWDQWVKSQGIQPDQDLPICLANLPQDQWIPFSKVLPPPDIQRYIDSDDDLTNHTIDMMELAMERDYKVTEPWYINCERTGSEKDLTLAVTCFRLMTNA